MELAQRVGYSAATIRKLERDELRPSKQLAELLAQALDVATTVSTFWPPNCGISPNANSEIIRSLLMLRSFPTTHATRMPAMLWA